MFQVEEVEGFAIKNIEGMRDPDLPPCGRNNSCGSVDSDDYLNNFKNVKKDKYILKTKIVTPVCPKNPYDRVGSDWHRDRDDTNKNTGNQSTVSTTLWDISSNMNRANLTNVNTSSDKNNNNDTNKDAAAQSANFFNSNTMLNANIVSTPEKKNEPEPAKAEDKKSAPEDLSKCPPCPACERCPEPTVDCKKIVKYKNQSYPVPLIADFSSFSKFG